MDTIKNLTVKSSKLIVVKIGSSLLMGDLQVLQRKWLDSVCDDIFEIQQRGQSIVIVTSGAISVGMEPLGLSKKSLRLEEKQAAAAAGQHRPGGPVHVRRPRAGGAARARRRLHGARLVGRGEPRSSFWEKGRDGRASARERERGRPRPLTLAGRRLGGRGARDARGAAERRGARVRGRMPCSRGTVARQKSTQRFPDRGECIRDDVIMSRGPIFPFAFRTVICSGEI